MRSPITRTGVGAAGSTLLAEGRCWVNIFDSDLWTGTGNEHIIGSSTYHTDAVEGYICASPSGYETESAIDGPIYMAVTQQMDGSKSQPDFMRCSKNSQHTNPTQESENNS